MPISAHEILLILRARDEGSRVLRTFGGNFAAMNRKQQEAIQARIGRGTALATAGVAVAAAGGLALAALNRMTDAAIAYNHEAAVTLTQVDKTKVSLKDLEKMGIDVGKSMPVQFDQIQSSLYDIFSSIDVNAPQARKLLMQIAKDAVAGNTDMITTGRAVVGIINAFKLSVGDASHVSDVMFQLVRKGVGTYQQFTSTIGRAIPSAVKAGQSLEDLGGMLAFLTRNGLSTAMASASAARALDALANPKTIGNMRKLGDIAKASISDTFGKATLTNLQKAGVNFKTMGINVLDAQGKMKPVVQIVGEMNKSLNGLTKAQKAVVLHELFKGAGGTIQAMRFFNHALNDTKGLLPEMTKAMRDAGGATDAAFKIMKDTPQNKIQLMKNQWQALRIEIGNNLIPIKMALVKVLSMIFGWFSKLNPTVLKWITLGVALAAALAVVVGVIVALVGVFILMSAAAEIAGTSLGAIFLAATGVGLILAAIVVAVILVIKYWKQISAFGVKVWNDIYKAIQPVLKAITDFAGKEWEKIKKDFEGAGEAAGHLKNAARDVLNFIKVVLRSREAGDALKIFVQLWKLNWKIVVAVVQGVWGIIKIILDQIVNVVGGFIKLVIDLINGDWKKAWHDAVKIVSDMFKTIGRLFGGLWGLVVGVLKAFITGVINFFKHLFDILVGHSIIPDLINAIVKWFASLPGKILHGLWNFILTVVSYFAQLPGKILSAVGDVASLLFNKGMDIIRGLGRGIVSAFGSVLSWVAGIGGRIAAGIGNLGSSLFSAGVNAVQGLINGMRSQSGLVFDVGSLVGNSASGGLASHFKMSSPSRLTHQYGRWIDQGLINGMLEGKREVNRTAANLFNPLAANTNGYKAPVGYGQASPGVAHRGAPNQNFYITTQEIDPRKHAADLGWQMATRVV